MAADRLARRFLVLSLTILLVLVGSACGDDAETIVEEADEQDDPQLVLGRPFEFTAPVGDVLGPRGFRLLDTLVVTANPVNVAEGVRVVVRGTVHRWEPAAIESDLGVDFNEDVEDADDDLVVVADHVEFAPEQIESSLPARIGSSS